MIKVDVVKYIGFNEKQKYDIYLYMDTNIAQMKIASVLGATSYEYNKNCRYLTCYDETGVLVSLNNIDTLKVIDEF